MACRTADNGAERYQLSAQRKREFNIVMMGRIRRAVKRRLRNPAREAQLVAEARLAENDKFERMNWDLEAAIDRLEYR